MPYLSLYSEAMHALQGRRCCQLLSPVHPVEARRCRLRVQSLKRRDLFVSTVSLISAADAVASETEPAAQQEAAAAAAAAADGSTAAAAPAPAGKAAAGSKPKKKRRKPAPRPKPTLKPPGEIPRVQLADNLSVSKVIRGCWQLDGQHKGDSLSDRTSGAAAIEDLDAFCRAGITTIDTADNYGGSELLIGQHLRLNPQAAFSTQVMTKLSFMTPPAAVDLRRENIEYRVRSSIARLGVPTIDLLQLHWEPPIPPAPPAAPGNRGSSSKGQPPPGFVTAAKVMKQLQQEGLIKQFGVSNFDVPMLLALLDAGVKPVSNQVSYSVIDRRPELFLSRFCEARGISLLAYGTLAGGFLAERFRELPADKARIDTLSKARYGTLLKQLGGWGWMQDMLQVLHDIGEKHGVSPSCVASRWVLQQPGVSAVIVGARNATHIRDAQRLFSPGFELDEEDLFDLDAVYEGATQPTTDVYAWERGGEW